MKHVGAVEVFKLLKQTNTENNLIKVLDCVIITLWAYLDTFFFVWGVST